MLYLIYVYPECFLYDCDDNRVLLTPQIPSWSPVGTACRRNQSLSVVGVPGRGRELQHTHVTMLAVGKRTQRAPTSKHITAHTQVCNCMLDCSLLGFCRPLFFALFISGLNEMTSHAGSFLRSHQEAYFWFLFRAIKHCLTQLFDTVSIIQS